VKQLDYDSPELSILRKWEYGERGKDTTIILFSVQPSSEEDIEALKKGTFYSFANSPSNIKDLNLWSCGSHHDNNWKEHPERLEGLLAAMAKTPIKDSLEKIWVSSCGVNKWQIRKMLDRHGFTNIKFIDT
jgi:hypothetical protein